jgi:hypothetical protein
MITAGEEEELTTEARRPREGRRIGFENRRRESQSLSFLSLTLSSFLLCASVPLWLVLFK